MYKFADDAQIDEIYEKYYKKIDKTIFRQIIKADPYSKVKGDDILKIGIYAKWLLTLFLKNNLLTEDLYKATEYITLFDKNKSKIKQNNIYDYKNLGDLYTAVQPFEKKEELVVETETDEEKIIKKKQTKTPYEDSKWVVKLPLSYDSAALYGMGTKWCTTGKGAYGNYSNLTIIINKTKKDSEGRAVKYQTDYNQFMDAMDRSVPLKKLFEEFSPGLVDWILTEKLKVLLKYDNNASLVNKNLVYTFDNVMQMRALLKLSDVVKIDNILENKDVKELKKIMDTDFSDEVLIAAHREAVEKTLEKRLVKAYEQIFGKVSKAGSKYIMQIDCVEFVYKIWKVKNDISDLELEIKIDLNDIPDDASIKEVLKTKQLRKKSAADEDNDYDKKVHKSTKKFWDNLPLNNGHDLGKHPIFAVYGNELSRDSYKNTKDRKDSVNAPTSQMLLMQLFENIMQRERRHKDKLENIAIKAVAEVWGIPESQLRAQLTPNIDLNTSDEIDAEEFEDMVENDTVRKLINKRITLNSLVHGSSVNAMMTIHHLVGKELKRLDPMLIELYDQISVGSYHIYWMVDFSQFNLKNTAAGSTKIDYEMMKNEDGEKEETPVVTAKAYIFPVLIQELCKGVAEMITHHGLNGIEEKTLKNVLKNADAIENEPWIIQVGTSLWKKFNTAIIKMNQTRELKVTNAQILMYLSQEDADEVTKIIEAVLENQESGAFILNQLIIKKENLSNILDDLEGQLPEDYDRGF